MHQCTEKDFQKFYEPHQHYTERFRKLQESGALQCIDWESADLAIQGSEASGNYITLDILAVPCHMRMDILESDGGVYVDPPSYCDWDYERATNYIGNVQVVVLYNQGRFQQDEYGRLRVEKLARIEAIQVDAFRANFIPWYMK